MKAKPRRVQSKALRRDPKRVRKTAGRGADSTLELRRLRREVKTYTHQLGLIRKTALHLTTDLSLEQVLDAMVTTTMDFFSADAVSIMLWDDLQNYLVSRAGYGFKSDYLQKQRIPADRVKAIMDNPSGYVYTEDLRTTPYGDPKLIAGENLVSVLSIILHSGQKSLGAINIYSRHRIRRFSPQEIENARLLAQQAAVVVRNAHLYGALHEEAQIAKTLLQVAEDVGTLDSLDEVMNRIVLIITRSLRFRLCAIFLWDQDKRLFMPVKAVGVPPHRSPFFPTLILSSGDLPFTELELRQREVIVISKTPNRFPEEKLANVFLERELNLVPLVTKGKLMGAVVAAGRSPGDILLPKDEIFFRGIVAQAAIAIDDANLFEALERAFWDIIKTLAAAIEIKDRYTHSHSESVSLYGRALARAMHLSRQDEEMISKACLLHDLGKIGVEDDILRKDTPLTIQERKAIEEHPVIGAQILQSVRSLSDISRIVRHHHEHYDGSGYPDHLQGEQIPLHSRILQIADCFDAMTSNRPYRQALTQLEAMEELRRNSGQQFDPQLVELFLQILENRHQEINLKELAQKQSVKGEKGVSWY